MDKAFCVELVLKLAEYLTAGEDNETRGAQRRPISYIAVLKIFRNK